MSALVSYLRRARKTEVSPKPYRDMLRAAKSFSLATRRPDEWRWYLVRGVPISVLDEEGVGIPTLADFEYEESEDDVLRYRILHKKLALRGEKPWPVVVSPEGEILDGIHRLSVLSDAGVEKIDVLWAARPA